MKWVWYVYEVDERPQSQHNSTTCAKNQQPVLPYHQAHQSERYGTSGVRTHAYACPLHIKYGKHLNFICMKRIWYVYEVDKRTQS